jgi:hypothetical protein
MFTLETTFVAEKSVSAEQTNYNDCNNDPNPDIIIKIAVVAATV